ncbi:hypothetical protein DV736_g6400, partial [Chaetothyriales sp. CBS 134916]
MSGRALRIGGVVAAAAAGYYLYTAGGDPKVAQKKAEADASQLSSKLKSGISGKEKELETKEQELKQSASGSLDKAVTDAKTIIAHGEKKASEYQLKASKELNKAVDKFDKEVTEKAVQAKSGISSWFGGSK